MDISSIENFKAKVVFSMETDGFIVKTASTLDDLKLALKLRHQVFLEEGLGRSHETGLEFDSFDHLADHLLIIEKDTGIGVGTYRLINSKFSDKFYSQGEFNLEKFLALDGNKLEMGRACTHIDHRTGRTVDLLWQGLSRYIIETNSRYLFGCSSIDSIDPDVVFTTLKSLEAKDRVRYDYKIMPTEKYQFENAQNYLDKADIDPKVNRSLPPLLRSYLHAGSKVHGFPAKDEDFKCADLFTVLDMEDLNRKFSEHYIQPYLQD